MIEYTIFNQKADELVNRFSSVHSANIHVRLVLEQLEQIITDAPEPTDALYTLDLVNEGYEEVSDEVCKIYSDISAQIQFYREVLKVLKQKLEYA